jgi:protease I
MKALFLIADGFDDLQLFVPWYRLQEEGLAVTLASPSGLTVTGEHGYQVEPDLPIRDVSPAEFDLLFIPGGRAPERLRLREEAVDVARTFMEDDRRVCAVSHGPQLLISAGALGGRSATCHPAIRDDLRAAGASYRDDGVVLDGNLLTCRGSDDLPELCRSLLASLGARA